MAVLALALVPVAFAADVWYEDNNLGRSGGIPPDFQEKFRHTESFARATRYIDVYMMRSSVLNVLDDQFLRELFIPYLERNNIKLAINTGGATWAQLEGRERVSNRDISLLKRLSQLGARVDYISLQSVLSKTPKIAGQRSDYALARRIADVVAFARAAHDIFPDAEIGIIDALPSQGKQYQDAYRRLRDALVREGLRLSYIHLDIPFDIPRGQRRGVTWDGIREVERYVEEDLGVKFGYFTTTRRGGQSSSKAFHAGVLASLECYAGVGGTPAAFIVASWFPFPERTIPDNATGDDYPAMRTVAEFGRELDQIERGGAAWVSEHAADPAWQGQCGLSGARY
jgi:hypothetical protein